MALVVTVSVKEEPRLSAPGAVVPVSQSFDALITGIAGVAAYAAGDAIGAMFEIPNLVPDSLVSRCSLWIQTIEVLDRDGQNKMLDLFVADETFTAVADNAAFALSAPADLLKTALLDNLATASSEYIAAGAGLSVRTRRAFAHSIRPKGSSLFAQVIAREAVTYTNGLALRIFGFIG